jgi:acyl carrier protein
MSQSQPVADRVQSVFARVFGKKVAFNPALKRIDEPRWTSLKHVEFIVALEGEFGIRFDGADATDMISIDVVCATVQKRLS